MHFRTHQEPNNGDWRWTLIADNNRKIATSGEGYRNKADCLSAIALVQNTTTKTPIDPPKGLMGFNTILGGSGS